MVTTYNPKKHPQQLLKLMKEGKDICYFCGDNLIVRSTFFLWVKTHPEFKEAYDMGKQLAEAYWIELGKSGTIQPSIWSRMMTVKFGYAAERSVKLRGMSKAKTLAEEAHVIGKLVRKGAITPSEASILTNTLQTVANINEKTQLAKDVEELKELVKK